MKIGWIGLGKLGLPVALAIKSKGHEVKGWDASEVVRQDIADGDIGYQEAGAQRLFEEHGMDLAYPVEIAAWADLIFIAVQTPHRPPFEGVTPLPGEREDFDYTHLTRALVTLRPPNTITDRPDLPPVVVVSTVLPGTMDRIVRKIGYRGPIGYNPSFIAMGSAIQDFLDPEMSLVGGSPAVCAKLTKFYATIHDAPVVTLSIPSAELAKVAYNTMIGAKIATVNVLAQICDQTPGADVDQVTEALSFAGRRIWSPDTYFRAGMGDGGGCHPRDNIALSWLSRKLGLGHDLFEALMLSRQAHAEWVGEMAARAAEVAGLPVRVFGYAYKAGSPLEVGSPAKLMMALPSMRAACSGWIYDPHIPRFAALPPPGPAVIVIGTNHPEFEHYPYPTGSVVIDPWGCVQVPEGVTLIRPGREATA